MHHAQHMLDDPDNSYRRLLPTNHAGISVSLLEIYGGEVTTFVSNNYSAGCDCGMRKGTGSNESSNPATESEPGAGGSSLSGSHLAAMLPIAMFCPIEETSSEETLLV